MTLSDIIAERYSIPTVGMVNLGSSCYMNSALQSIFRSRYLCSLLLSPYYESQVQAGNQVASALFRTLRQYQKAGTRAIVPREFADILPVFGMSPY